MTTAPITVIVPERLTGRSDIHHLTEPPDHAVTVCGLTVPHDELVPLCSDPQWHGERFCLHCGGPFCLRCLSLAGDHRHTFTNTNTENP